MKHLPSALLALLTFAVYCANAENRYISDELFTYMHAGPGTQFRIIGSVNSGTEVTQIKENSGYTQIIDNRGRQGWVDTKFISAEPSIKTRLPQLEAELEKAQATLQTFQTDFKNRNKDLIDSLTSRTNRVTELEAYNSELNQQLIDAQAEIRELNARVDTQKDDLLIRYFTYGGIVAGCGLLFGLILPHLIPRRKKHHNGWA